MGKDTSRRTGFPLSQQEFLILASLAAGPKHGYAIAKDVLELTDGKVKFSAATLYENLSELLDKGFIERAGDKEVEPGERRKTYRITAEGATVLNEQLGILQKAQAAIPRLLPDVS